jgi:hypothetical protein
VITPEHETARPATGPGFADAVTFAWGDREAGLYGLARLGLAGGGQNAGSALAVLFAGREPVAATARGNVEVPAGADFTDVSLGGLTTTTRTPLRHWTVTFAGANGAGFDLEFEALGAPAEIDPAEPVARAGGMVGYEQLCRVRGTVRTAAVAGDDGAGGAVAGTVEHTIDCLGQRSHLWGEPDWERIEATRTVNAWIDGGTGVSVTAVRAPGADGHDTDAAWGVLLDPAGSLYIDESRLSTTYDGDGHQRRAGLELWVGDDGYPRRAAGEVLCGSTFDLGQLRLDCAFFAWHMDGREGVGRYDVVRRA